MFNVLYIAVALLQLSSGQEIDNEPDTTKDVESPVYLEETFISHIQPNTVDENEIKIADEIPTSGGSFEDVGDPLEPSQTVSSGGLVNAQEENTIAAHYGEESNNEPSDEGIAPEDSCINEAVHNNIIRISSPVKTEGKVTIIAHFGCEDDFDKSKIFNDDIKSADNEDVNESIPISFSGPVKAQGTVSIAAHFNCGENGGNDVTLDETDSKEIIVDEMVPNGCVSFGGPVHAQGKVSVGTHFGCGPPVVIPPIFLPMPWSSAFIYPQYIFPYPYSSPGSFSTQYPFPKPEKGSFTSPICIEHTDTENKSFNDSQEYLPVASIMANSISVSDEDDDLQHGNMNFNGIVPACGTVKIAARF